MDINQNIAECIKTTSDFGSNVVHNVCNGTTQVVPWGSFDWVGFTLLTVGACAVIFLIAAFGRVVWNDA